MYKDIGDSSLEIYIYVRHFTPIFMKIPEEITNIIKQIGIRNLSFSEKRKLLHWYEQLSKDKHILLTEEEEEATQKKIFSYIEQSIKGEPVAKNIEFPFWLKRLLSCYLVVPAFQQLLD